tara:strand:- start:2054 stop:2353 length:300 start_codon:yes stop_codon:yes gene_type:complete
MKKSLKILLIYNELKKYNSENFDEKEILNASKDLIKFSQDDYINKETITSSNNNNLIPLDKIITNRNFYKKERHMFNLEEEEISLNSEERDFNFLNKAA